MPGRKKSGTLLYGFLWIPMGVIFVKNHMTPEWKYLTCLQISCLDGCYFRDSLWISLRGTLLGRVVLMITNSEYLTALHFKYFNFSYCKMMFNYCKQWSLCCVVRYVPRQRCPERLYHTQMCPVQTTVVVERNPSTGQLLGYKEVSW